MTDNERTHERHRSTPEPDGGIVWWSRPVFDRWAWWTMIGAVNALRLKEV